MVIKCLTQIVDQSVYLRNVIEMLIFDIFNYTMKLFQIESCDSIIFFLNYLTVCLHLHQSHLLCSFLLVILLQNGRV